jgi:aryl-alcohol dehydrogenase-like predicted oxidoreductase
LTRNLEEELIPVCKKLNVTIVAYSPLARNLLATKLEAPPSDWRATYSQENLEKNRKFTDILEDVASKYGCTPAQMALAWLFQNTEEQLGVTVVPIPGTTKIENAMSNVKATEVNISSPEDMKTPESLAVMVSGECGPEGYMKMGIEAQK